MSSRRLHAIPEASKPHLIQNWAISWHTSWASRSIWTLPRTLAKRHGLWLIEDNCDALGSRYRGRLTALLAIWPRRRSIRLTTITMEKVGLVVTDDDDLARDCTLVPRLGRDCYCSGGESNTCGKRFSQQFGTFLPGMTTNTYTATSDTT